MPKAITQEVFLIKAKEAHKDHPDRYDYSKVIFKNYKSKITITCKTHGDFEQLADAHLKGSGCVYCPDKTGKSNKLTQKEFLERCVAHHGDNYDYSKTVYVNKTTKVIIICKQHGEFTQIAEGHMTGKRCIKCGIEKQKRSLKGIPEALPPPDKNIIDKRHDKEVKKLSETYNLEYNFPDLMKYWIYDEKINSIPPNKIYPCTHELYWWKCLDDLSHPNYQMAVSRKTDQKNPQGCPYCGKVRLCESNSLATCLEVAKEWDYEKNAPLTPKDVFRATKQKAWWKCPNGHSYETKIYMRTTISDIFRPTGCPECFPRHSKVSIEWLQYVMEKDKIHIQHAKLNDEDDINDEGEFKIPGTLYSADGYCKETNTVYEFHGSYWHGDPARFKPDDINKYNNKTFKYLYDKTLARDQKIRKLGFNLVVIWESEWIALKKTF